MNFFIAVLTLIIGLIGAYFVGTPDTVDDSAFYLST
jgi:hypothetical protein